MYLISFFLVSFNYIPHVVQRNDFEKMNIELVLKHWSFSWQLSIGKENILYFSCKLFVAKIAVLFFVCSLFSS